MRCGSSTYLELRCSGEGILWLRFTQSHKHSSAYLKSPPPITPVYSSSPCIPRSLARLRSMIMMVGK